MITQATEPSPRKVTAFDVPRGKLIRYFYRPNYRESDWVVLLTDRVGKTATVVHAQGTCDDVGATWNAASLKNACSVDSCGVMELYNGKVTLENG
jgi:hypothetical protein